MTGSRRLREMLTAVVFFIVLNVVVGAWSGRDPLGQGVAGTLGATTGFAFIYYWLRVRALP